MTRRLVGGAGVCVLALVLVVLELAPQTGLAQAADPQFVSSSRFTIARGQMEAFRKFVIEEWNPLVKKGGLQERHFWIPRTGEGSVVIMSTPSRGPAQLDEPSYVRKATGNDQKTLEAFRQKLDRLIVGSERSIHRVRTDLTSIPATPQPFRAAEVYIYEIVDGQQAVFEESLTTLLGAARKAKLGRWVAQRAYGGLVNEVISMTLYPSFADLAKGGVIERTMGAEAQASFLQKIRPAIRNVRGYLSEYDAEMSFAPASTSSQP